MNKLIDMLRTSAMADKAKALLSLELLGDRIEQLVLVITQQEIFIKMLKKH